MKKILISEWRLASIFGVWSQKKKKNGQTKQQMKMEHVWNKK